MSNTREWPIWRHHMVGHEGCSSFTEHSHDKIFKATQYSQIWLYSEQTFYFFNVTVSPIVLSFETWDKLILSPIFRRMNKHPLLELQSQLKLLRHFAVFLHSQCWCARFGEFTAINNIGRTRRQARSKKTALGGCVWTIFVLDCSSPLPTQKN